MRLHKSEIILPGSIYSKYMDGKYREEGFRELEKKMPYLDPETGLNNRMITRDPVTGLGDFSDEWDPLSGAQIHRKSLPKRDPIRMEGEIGQEYNCLYTTKELKCKPREERDPITLKGDLGEEMDFLRPNGVPSKSIINPKPTDPITHSNATNGSEVNLSARQNSGRWTRTDPITHTNPETGTRTGRTVKQYNERWVHRDPILHEYGNNEPTSASRGNQMRHYSSQRSINPITHLPSTFHGQKEEHGSDGNSVESGQLPPRGTSMRTKGSCSADRVKRNPITGEGMKPEDYLDLRTLPRDYHLRNRESSIITPKRSVQQPRHIMQSPKRSNKLTRSMEASPRTRQTTPPTTTAKTPEVKKVIRPKKSIPVAEVNTVTTEDKPMQDASEPTQEPLQGNGFIQHETLTEKALGDELLEAMVQQESLETNVEAENTTSEELENPQG